jgi:hypothetical protein
MEKEQHTPGEDAGAESPRRDWMAPKVMRLTAGGAEGSIQGAGPTDYSRADPAS